MFFVVVMGAQRVMIMISMTAVACVREHYVLVLVVADPIPAAFGLGRFRVFPQRPHRALGTAFWGFFFAFAMESSYEECLYHGDPNFHPRQRGRVRRQRPNILIPSAICCSFNAFPLDSNSRFVMIYRGGKSIL
jgi:predicted N-acetyltransferase YhbS